MTSSMRSSSVTMPAVPPYSSTTIAMWWPSRRISDMAGSTFLLPGSIFTSRVTSATFMPRARVAGTIRSRTCRKPRTSSCDDPATGYRECGCSAVSLTARLSVMPASRNATSVRGSITSRSWRSPAAKTSSMSLRSSLVSDSCWATRPRSSSSVMALPCSEGSTPNSRTTRLVLRDSNQMTGRKTVASRSSGPAQISAQPSARCSAMRLGASSLKTSDR